ncbi:MAG: HDOD domain-containing protein [Polyangiales bacterium]
MNTNGTFAVGDTPMEERSEKMLDRALELSALSSSVQELLSLTRRDDAELGPVLEALGKDPSLAAAVLRAANSPVYGQSRSVADLSRAISVLGMQELHDLVASTAMMAAFARPDPLSQRLQTSAPISASIAQKLAPRLGAVPSTAYLGGLMCELGARATLALDPAYAELYWSAHAEPRRRFADERTRYGRTTAEIGGRMLAASDIPTAVCESVSAAGHESNLPQVARVVAFARLAAGALLAATEHGEPDVLFADLSKSAALVGLDGVEPDVLMRVSLGAASEAALTLKGDFAPSGDKPANDVQPTPTHRPSISVPKQSRAPLVAVCGFGLVLFGALVWYLVR